MEHFHTRRAGRPMRPAPWRVHADDPTLWHPPGVERECNRVLTVKGWYRAANRYSPGPGFHLDVGGLCLGLATRVCLIRHHDYGVADRTGRGVVDDY